MREQFFAHLAFSRRACLQWPNGPLDDSHLCDTDLEHLFSQLRRFDSEIEQYLAGDARWLAH
jgi:hypothetical protein